MDVYTVTHCEDSDFEVVAIYSERNKDRAYEHAGLIGGEVSVYEIDPRTPIDPGKDYFYFEVGSIGKIIRLEKRPRLERDGSMGDELCCLRTSKDCPYYRKYYWRFTGLFYADDEESARRWIIERWRQIKAGQRPEGVDFGKN